MLDTMEKSACGPPVCIVKKRKAPLALAGLLSTVVLVGKHDARSPCRPESIADEVDHLEDVVSVLTIWPSHYPQASLDSAFT